MTILSETWSTPNFLPCPILLHKWGQGNKHKPAGILSYSTQSSNPHSTFTGSTPLIGRILVLADDFCADLDDYFIEYEIQVIEDRRIYLDEDTRLMVKVSEGDEEAYERLYEKYTPILASYFINLNSHRTLIKDLVQETFTRIWEKREEYRPTAAFKTFLFTYAKNVLLEKQKKLTKEAAIICRFSFEYHCSFSGAPNNPEREACRTELIKNTRQTISKLPPKQKQAIMLFYVTGDSIAKCAERAKCSVKAFEGRLYHACERLHQLLKADEF